MSTELINKFNKVHNNQYDYSKLGYSGMRNMVNIICKKHGEFDMYPSSHLKGSKCLDCKRNDKQNIFIEKSIEIYGDEYDYSLVNFISNKTPVIIICKKHGEFDKQPYSHLNGQGCKICYYDSMYLTNTEFIERSEIIHDNKYDYSLTKYIRNNIYVEIICPLHGIFKQFPNNHMNQKQGCGDCKNESMRVDFDTFVNKSNLVHNNRYDYPQQPFNFNDSVEIICPLHGSFNQMPNNHSNLKHGCTTCNSSKGELFIDSILRNHNINYITEHKFEDCSYKRKLPFDFYLPDYNICIEYNGIQHYESLEYFGGEERLVEQKVKDNIKKEYCMNNNYSLIVFKYDQSEDDIESILKELLK